LIMSIERMRVARSDWCPSRMVVSVISRFFCASIQSATALGPFSSSSCAGAGGRVLGCAQAGGLGVLGRRRAGAALGLGVPVHGDVGDVGQHLGRAVAALGLKSNSSASRR
jgi:hypothetical protein